MIDPNPNAALLEQMRQLDLASALRNERPFGSVFGNLRGTWNQARYGIRRRSWPEYQGVIYLFGELWKIEGVKLYQFWFEAESLEQLKFFVEMLGGSILPWEKPTEDLMAWDWEDF